MHVPFCGRRCSYCDFAIAVRRSVPVREYVDAVGRELSLRANGESGWDADTLYLGGGTPSKLGADGVRHLLDAVSQYARVAADGEVTLEANPEDVTVDAVRAWRSAGINRLSLGAQSFDDGVLRWMHRTHSAEQIVTALEIARSEGITNVSIDLIFALTSDVERVWADDLEKLRQLAPPHVSLYGLTIEPTTVLGRRADRGELASCSEENYETEFMLAHRLLTDAGYQHYEVSNFSRPGFRSRHNSAYWLGVPYVGVGPSAHGFDGRVRSWNIGPYRAWLASVQGGALPTEESERLTPANEVAEEVYLGLRTAEGLDVVAGELSHVGRWIEAGWATVNEVDRLTLTPSGWMRLDTLAADLTLIRSR